MRQKLRRVVIYVSLMLLTGVFFRRLWCAWICPVAGLSELCATINHRTVNIRRLGRVRYAIFAVWFAVLITGFTAAGGISVINPFHLTDRGISVDEPLKFITSVKD